MKPLSTSKVENTEYSKCSFASSNDLQETLFNGAIRQGSLFKALSVLKETDRLNEVKVVSDYTISQVKMYFRENGMSSDKQENGNGFPNNEMSNIEKPKIKRSFPQSKNPQNEVGMSQKENQEIKVEVGKGKIKSENIERESQKTKTEKLKRDMTKGYLKMLSDMNS